MMLLVIIPRFDAQVDSVAAAAVVSQFYAALNANDTAQVLNLFLNGYGKPSC
jgi:hypothetical protein